MGRPSTLKETSRGLKGAQGQLQDQNSDLKNKVKTVSQTHSGRAHTPNFCITPAAVTSISLGLSGQISLGTTATYPPLQELNNEHQHSNIDTEDLQERPSFNC